MGFCIGIEKPQGLCFHVNMKPIAPYSHTKTTRQLYRIEKKAICFFRFILEGYDGAAILETLDPKAGIIALHVAPGCEDMVDGIIHDLAGDHLVEAL